MNDKGTKEAVTAVTVRIQTLMENDWEDATVMEEGESSRRLKATRREGSPGGRSPSLNRKRQDLERAFSAGKFVIVDL